MYLFLSYRHSDTRNFMSSQTVSCCQVGCNLCPSCILYMSFLFGCVLSLILTVPPFISFCVYHFHMMGVLHWDSQVSIFIIVLCDTSFPRLSPFFNSTENKHKQIASSCSPNHPSCLCECIPCLKGTWCVSVFELHKKSWKPPSVTSQIATPTRERIDGGVVAQWPDTSPHTYAGFGRSGQSTHFDTVLSRWMTVYTVCYGH